MTIWNKIIQQLVMGDDSSVRLAFHLCTDKVSIFHWRWLYSFQAEELGLVRHGGKRSAWNYMGLGGMFVSDSLIRQNYNQTNSESYLLKIKPKL